MFWTLTSHDLNATLGFPHGGRFLAWESQKFLIYIGISFEHTAGSQIMSFHPMSFRHSVDAMQ